MRTFARSAALLAALCAVHLALTACAPEGPARADDAALEPCILGVAEHRFPGVTLPEMAAVHVVIRTGHGLGAEHAQALASFEDQMAFVQCPPLAEVALFVLP